MTEKKQRTHRFFDKYTILSAIILMLIGLIVIQILGSVLGSPITKVTGNESLGTGLGCAIIAFLTLGAYKLWFRPEFEGNLKGGDLGLGMKLSLIFVVYWIIMVPVSFIFSDAEFGAPTIGSVFMAIMAGTSEEVAFRGLPISYLMRQWRDEKHILPALLFTSGLFGVIHLVNVFAGGNPGSVVLQTISAVSVGITLGAIYLRCGNLLITIMIHTVQDIIAFTDVSNVKDGIVVGSVDVSSIIDVVASIIMALIGIWLIRPAKRGEIRRVWDKKWGINE